MNPQSVLVTVEGITVEAPDNGIALPTAGF